MANLAQIAGLYTFLLFDGRAPSTARGHGCSACVFIAVDDVDLRHRHRAQRHARSAGLLGAEIVTLAALRRRRARARATRRRGPPSSIDPALVVVLPVRDRLDRRALIDGVLIGVFIYWGWDSLVTVNEETEDSDDGARQGGRHGDRDPARHLRDRLDRGASPSADPTALADDETGDVARPAGQRRVRLRLLGKLVIIAVLTSAAASTQTTILPTARTSLSMAAPGRDAGGASAQIHPQYLTPHDRRRSGWARCRSSGTSA